MPAHYIRPLPIFKSFRTAILLSTSVNYEKIGTDLKAVRDEVTAKIETDLKAVEGEVTTKIEADLSGYFPSR